MIADFTIIRAILRLFRRNAAVIAPIAMVGGMFVMSIDNTVVADTPKEVQRVSCILTMPCFGVCPAHSKPAPGFEYACAAEQTETITAITPRGEVLRCEWTPRPCDEES